MKLTNVYRHGYRTLSLLVREVISLSIRSSHKCVLLLLSTIYGNLNSHKTIIRWSDMCTVILRSEWVQRKLLCHYFDSPYFHYLNILHYGVNKMSQKEKRFYLVLIQVYHKTSKVRYWDYFSLLKDCFLSHREKIHL